EGQLAVSAPFGKEAAEPAFNVLHEVARIRIARAKENAVALSDAGKRAEAAAALRELVKDLRRQGLDEEFDIAEEVAQLEYFADTVKKGKLGTDERKVLRDQS